MTDTPPSDADRELGHIVAEHLERLEGQYVGVAVGILAGDQRITLGTGSTGPSGGTPDRRTSFQIGSITKTFTALLLADAVERGQVELDQPVGSLIPGVATHPRGRPITLSDLATHSSGLPRLPPGLRRQAIRHRADPYGEFTIDDLLVSVGRSPRRPPGRKVRYSNFGYGVLGHALERATGHTYEELVRDRIADPLGMHDTVVVPGDDQRDRLAVGHSRGGDPVPAWRLPAMQGAGALRSTVDDLLAFAAAHLDPDGSPLAAPIRRAMRPQRPAGRHLRIGLAWQVLDRKGDDPWWWHNGGTGGFFSFLGMDPAARSAVVVLTNTTRSVDRLAMSILGRLQASGSST